MGHHTFEVTPQKAILITNPIRRFFTVTETEEDFTEQNEEKTNNILGFYVLRKNLDNFSISLRYTGRYSV